MTTVFGRIIRGEIPSEKVFDNDRILAIKDIHPVAPIHFLIFPKKEIPNLQSVMQEDYPLLIEIFSVAQQLAKQYNIAETGYRFLTNNGPDSDQIVHHLHFHLIGGIHLGPIAKTEVSGVFV